MTDSQAQAFQALATTFGLIGGLIGLAAIILGIIIYWRIFSKAGYSGALSLLMLVPVANIVVLCILAFGQWPIYRELNQLRQQVGARPPQYPQYPQNPQNPQYQ